MVNPINYNDFTGLRNLEAKAANQDPESLKAAAQQFESMFINMMLKSMRDANASIKSDLFSDQSESLYQEMHDHQLSINLSHHNGIGLTDILVKQLSKNFNGKTP